MVSHLRDMLCNTNQCLHAALDQEAARVREEGGIPFFVGATAGTTVLGAFDPLDRIAEVSRCSNTQFTDDPRLSVRQICE